MGGDQTDKILFYYNYGINAPKTGDPDYSHVKAAVICSICNL